MTLMPAQAPEIERINRLYSAMTRVSQVIARTRSRAELFDDVVTVLVREGAFGMAWIGWHDPETQRMVPTASAGDEGGYLEHIEVFADERPGGDGPTGRAFRSGMPYICNDIATDPATVPWRAELTRRGFGASAVVPIHTSGVVRGTLSVYADRVGYFQDKEVALLTEAGAGISFALDNLAREEARRSADDIVKRLAAIVASTGDAIISKTLAGVITSWNPAAQRMFGYAAAEMVGRSLERLIPPDRVDEETMIMRRVSAGDPIKQLETIRLHKDGTPVHVSITISPIWNVDDGAPGDGRVFGVSKILRDITARKHADALAASEQRFASGLIEAMPGIFYHYDEHGHFLRWNRNFEAVSGYSADEIAQMHPLDFFAADDKPLLSQRIATVFEAGEASVEAALVSKDGRSTPYFLTGRRIVFDGAPRLLGVGMDITERHRAQAAVAKSEERYRTTLDTMLESCQLLDLEWRYLYLNPAAAIQNRRPNAELLGQRMPEAWPGIEATNVYALLRRCMEDRVTVHTETEFAFADGTAGWFDVRAQPVPEGIFVLSVEITERRRAQHALHELNASLERKVAERTLELDAARERAEAADRIKSAFLATMSHELRTPLNSILGFTGIVLKGMAGPLNQEQMKQLGMVQGSARHLLELINDVLDLSKIEAGQLEVRCASFELLTSVERVVASVMPHADKKGIAVRVVTPARMDDMVSDRRRVEQILINLLNNAIKFTDRGEVTLTVEELECADPSGAGDTRRMASMRVTDTGIGIQAEDLAKLFQPFHQVDTGLQRQHEGTGLGLAICRRLTGLLGGTVRAASTPGRGSVFTVLLPMTRAEVP